MSEISHECVDEVIMTGDGQRVSPITRHYLNFYIDDVWMGWFVVCSDGSVLIEMKDKEKTTVREKLVPMVAAFPSMVESISAEIDLRSPLEM